MQLVIIPYEGDPSHRLIKWAQFHRLPFTFYSPDTIYDEYNIFITSNLVPNTSIFSYVFQKKEVSTDITLTRIDEKWRKSFCIVGKSIKPTENTICDNSIVVSLRPGHYLTMMLEGTLSRYNALWSIIMNDWYKGGESYVSAYYFPLWVNTYHHDFIEKGTIMNKKWIKEQVCFSGYYERSPASERIYTMSEVKDLLTKTEITLEDCLNGLKGYEIKVDISHAMLTLHPFSINGIYKLIPTRSVNVDLSITLVAFYYDLKYENKPREGYYDSLRYFATLQYPIIFYGEEQVCKDLIEMRGDLTPFTSVICKKVEDWDLISRYKDDFEEFDLDLDFRFRRRYALLTCNKVHAVMDAIEKNPFYSTNFVWFDPGMYRHSLAKNIKTEEKPLRNLVFTDSFSVLTFNVRTGSKHGEFIKGHETVISSIMGGTKQAWKNIYPFYKQLTEESFSRKFFVTEQVMFTRLIDLQPELFTFLDFSYIPDSLKRVLKL